MSHVCKMLIVKVSCSWKQIGTLKTIESTKMSGGVVFLKSKKVGRVVKTSDTVPSLNLFSCNDFDFF